jgi:hypothetical protein
LTPKLSQPRPRRTSIHFLASNAGAIPVLKV